MNKIEKIVTVAGFVLTIPLTGIGVYKGNVPLTILGLSSGAIGTALVSREGVKKDDKYFLSQYK